MATTANHVLLQRITLSASAASITFDNIPQTGYTDLKIVVSPRTANNNGGRDYFWLRFNGDTGSNYTNTWLAGYDSGSTLSIRYTGSAFGGTFVQPDVVATANTFGNTEIYIPNYTNSSIQKSYSGDSVSENNSGSSWMNDLVAGLWTKSPTAAITSITIGTQTGNFAAGSSFSLYGIANAATNPALAPKADGGDIIKTDGTYWYHAFLSSGIFKPQVNLTCDVLQVAGGGGGGAGVGGGGGAGGVSYLTSQALSTGNQIVTVGAGGAGSTYSLAVRADSGNNSAVGSLTAAVGGGGGGRAPVNGASGGSGGGGYYNGTGGTATSGQGYAGGNGDTTREGSGGGGGAGGAGGNATATNGGAGGAGTNAYSSWLSTTGLGVSGYIAGGGGGGIYYSTSASGGSGGGGAASNSGSGGAGVAGTVNTGSGGGSANFNGASFYNGGAGGSGLVIIRYPVA